ncbi:MFS transporter [Halomicrococcus sp. NG-SE-24]|uniref:MFS transporter n=1 Tax=Halomicrococcus sp. NG-SE-24 TaxID=3436928 RepID=UPI003D99868F
MSAPTEASTPKALNVIPFVAVTSVGYVLFAPAAIPDVLTDRFDIGYTAFGLLTSVPLLSVVVAQAPSSYLTARYSTTRILLVATVVDTVVALTLDFARTFLALLALRTVWGLAGGVILTVGATHIARLHRNSKATRQQGFYGGALTLGGAIAFLAAPLLLEAVGAAGLHGPGALLGAFASAICWQHRDERSTHPGCSRPDAERTESAETASTRDRRDPSDSTARDRTNGESSSVRHLLTHPVVIVAAFCYVASLGSYVTLSTFVTAYFDALDVTGPLNAAVLLVATAGRAAGGVVAGRWDVRDWTSIVVATTAAVVGFFVLAFAHSRIVLALFPLVAMLAVSLPFGAIYGVAANSTVSEGAALAVVIAAGNLAALLLPTVTGAIRDATGDYSGAFVVLGAINAVAAAGVVALQRSSGPRSNAG